MGIFFDLAELVNILVSAALGEGVIPIKQRLAEAGTKRKLRKALIQVVLSFPDIEPETRNALVAMVEDKTFIANVCQGTAPDPMSGLDTSAFESLTQSVQDNLTEQFRGALIEVVVGTLTLAERTQFNATIRTTEVARGTHDTALANSDKLDAILLWLDTHLQGQVGPPPRIVVGSRPRVPTDFVARDEMAKLRAALETDGVATLCALQGMRGVGKSLLASKYAQECQEAGWSFVGWVNAASREQVVAQMAEVAVLVEKASLDDPPELAAKRLLKWLNETDQDAPQDRLLVFDNVENVDDLKDLVPQGTGTRVVITTTLHTKALGTPVDVGMFTPDQAVKYLLDHTGLDDREGAAQVAEDLGWLPVALTQAAAVISNRRYSFADYRQALEQYPLDDNVRLEGDPDHYPVKVGQALRIAYTDAIKSCAKADPEQGQAALAVLQALSLLSAAGVPDQWFYAAAINETAARDAVGELINRSVVNLSDDGREVYLHRLMGQVIREDDQTSNRTLEATQAAIGVVDSVKPDDTRDYMTNRTTITELGTHLAAIRTQVHSAVLWSIPEFLAVTLRTVKRVNDLQDPYTAVALAEYVNDQVQVLGPHHPDTLVFLNNLALAYESAGDLGRAIPLFEQSLAGRVRVFGPDHPHTLVSRNNLAGAYESAGDLGRAIPLFEQTLADMVRVLGPDHPLTLNSRNNLAYAYRSAGDLGRAILLYEQTLAENVRVLGPDHPLTLNSRNNLAYAYRSAGDLGRAIPLFEQSLAGRVRVFGPDHPDTLVSRNNLAHAYESAGDLGRAIPLYEQTLTGRVRVLGPDHPHTLISRNNLAGVYESAGDLGRAIPLYEQNMVDSVRVLGPDHPRTLISRNNLAGVYESAGDLGRAIPLLEQSLADHVRLFGLDDSRTKSVRAVLNRWMEKQPKER